MSEAGVLPGGAEIRSLSRPEEYAACVALQRDTWGTEYDGIVPASLLMVNQKVGGVVAGAFDAHGRLLGTVFSLAGFREGRPAHWSHMLAVAADARGHGLGVRLKLFQRREVLRQGVDTIFWTYDPLVARNAHMNLNRLGAEVDRFVPNLYGESDSPLHRGPTDRFIVRWRLESERAKAAMEGRLCGPHPEIRAAPLICGRLDAEGAPEVSSSDAWRNAGVVRVEIPGELERLLERDPGEARAWREATGRAFSRALARGYSVAGFYRDLEAARSFYWLARGDDRSSAA
ncbi:MAG: hypothetical protein ACE5HQ_03255 [Gemmatimonadota bacterium]